MLLDNPPTTLDGWVHKAIAVDSNYGDLGRSGEESRQQRKNQRSEEDKIRAWARLGLSRASSLSLHITSCTSIGEFFYCFQIFFIYLMTGWPPPYYSGHERRPRQGSRLRYFLQLFFDSTNVYFQK